VKRLVPGLVIGALILGASAVSAQDAGGTLAAVQERGQLVCGVNGGLPGMSVLNAETNQYDGMDADYCRALAAAVLGDANAVDYVQLAADQRATALHGGDVDVIFRNTTSTLERDALWGNFGPTIFYDGQGVMVRADLLGDGERQPTLDELAGATICVTSGTTTELNLADQMRLLGVEWETVPLADIDTVYGTYEEGRCDAVTSDRSQLVGRRSAFEDPDAHVILDAVISKEPLGPVVAAGDDQWADIVRWVVNATIQAEEYGITSDNLAEFQGGDNPEIARFLGETGELGSLLGLGNDFVVAVITAVGNYGQIYDRAFGPETLLALERGPNDLWTNGGLLYSPPFR
jgi:general L-amino acid transport system substrate-binding protein